MKSSDKKSIQDAILNMRQDIQNGLLGEDAKNEYLSMISDSTNQYCYLSIISEVYPATITENDALNEVGQKVCENILCIYRDTKKKDEKIANSLAESLVVDFPNTQNTNLLLRFSNLIQASKTFKAAVTTKNYDIIYSATKSCNLNSQEFLNGLLGYINICSKVALGRKFKAQSLTSSFNAKLEEYKAMQLHYIMPIFSNLADVEIRNAIAHGKHWHDRESNTLMYEGGRKVSGDIKSVSIDELFGKSIAGIQLAFGYLAAIATIQFLNTSIPEEFNLLPQNIRLLFQNDQITKV